MFTTTNKTGPAGTAQQSAAMGVFVRRMGFVVKDELFQYNPNSLNSVKPGPLGEMCKFMRVSGAGDIVYLNQDGVAQLWENALVGQIIPVVTNKVLITFDFGGAIGIKPTSATGILWYGGE